MATQLQVKELTKRYSENVSIMKRKDWSHSTDIRDNFRKQGEPSQVFAYSAKIKSLILLTEHSCSIEKIALLLILLSFWLENMTSLLPLETLLYRYRGTVRYRKKDCKGVLKNPVYDA